MLFIVSGLKLNSFFQIFFAKEYMSVTPRFDSDSNIKIYDEFLFLCCKSELLCVFIMWFLKPVLSTGMTNTILNGLELKKCFYICGSYKQISLLHLSILSITITNLSKFWIDLSLCTHLELYSQYSILIKN